MHLKNQHFCYGHMFRDLMLRRQKILCSSYSVGIGHHMATPGGTQKPTMTKLIVIGKFM